ncbi:probable pectinesterase/pectinesterase inhibitor 47 [Cajanus cajan]|uniref:Pectinesterase n=1 Tax=Cajanus cajan TaxID=3821 RepID=A0A151SY42_CAJCA|nr:probable pectinesterase/pectinesterase inhibitor 47 [Cajanus cajan]KYP59698.1 putative pectinesterase/pectinesterase inhibitor 47 [Cajanus cajan]
MSPPPFFYLLFLFLLAAPLLLAQSQSQSQTPPSTSTPSPSVACKGTLYPKLCRSIISAIRSSPSDPYGYGKFSIKQSLKQARKLAKVFEDFLQRHQSSSLNHAEIASLGDCRDLNQLNVDYLVSISEELKSAGSSDSELVEKIESYLSAVATNHYTCYDGLVVTKSSIANALAVPLKDVTQLYSVSLGLVTQALDKNLKRNRTRKHGLPTKAFKVRQPLEKLIKLLRTKYSCSKSNCTRPERILKESGSQGILLHDFVIVSHYGIDNYTSIGEAIAAAPNNTKPEDGYFLVYVREGYYEEYVVIPKEKKNILLVGDGINKTIITGNHSVIDGWTTFNSSTFAVAGERFTAVDVTFRNTAGPEKHQAVAVRNNADLSTFYRCSFEGYQDTLYVHSLRQFFRECDIYGTVDFIFGNAAVVFQDCNIYARKPLPNQKNAVTAQGRTDPNQNTGISIQNCTIDAAPDLAASLNSTPSYLGRPWKVYSRTVYLQSYIGDVIHPAGWLEWNGTVGLDTLFYGEFNNYGPGSNTSNRVQWPGYFLLNATQAWNFTVLNFTLGNTWLPDTDIPYTEGLLR